MSNAGVMQSSLFHRSQAQKSTHMGRLYDITFDSASRIFRGALLRLRIL